MSEEKISEKDQLQKKEIEKEIERPQEKQKEISNAREMLDVSAIRILEKEFIIHFKKELDKLRGINDYPEWVNEPWARIKPHKNFLEQWIKRWKDVILIYAQRHGNFSYSVTKITYDWPFWDGEKSLSINDIRCIVDLLVNEKLAKWLDDEKNYFIVYWVSTELLAEIAYSVMRKVGLQILRLSLLKEALYDMPISDLIKILSNIVNRGYADWIIEKQAIKIRAF